MFLVVTYDIADTHRRNRVASELQNFGARVQLSVFECHLTPAQVRDLQRRLAALINTQEDRVRYYPLCVKDQAQILLDGPGQITQDMNYFVI